MIYLELDPWDKSTTRVQKKYLEYAVTGANALEVFSEVVDGRSICSIIAEHENEEYDVLIAGVPYADMQNLVSRKGYVKVEEKTVENKKLYQRFTRGNT
ncbi:MAG: hypothetical protein QXJ81_01195 [Metallosphaera sp.]